MKSRWNRTFPFLNFFFQKFWKMQFYTSFKFRHFSAISQLASQIGRPKGTSEKRALKWHSKPLSPVFTKNLGPFWTPSLWWSSVCLLIRTLIWRPPKYLKKKGGPIWPKSSFSGPCFFTFFRKKGLFSQKNTFFSVFLDFRKQYNFKTFQNWYFRCLRSNFDPKLRFQYLGQILIQNWIKIWSKFDLKFDQILGLRGPKILKWRFSHSSISKLQV